MQAGPDRVLHIHPVALADPQDQSADLREIAQQPIDQFPIEILQLSPVAADRRLHRRGHRQHVGGQVDRHACLAHDVEKYRKFLPEHRDPRRDFRLVQRVQGEVRQIIQRHRIESGRRRLAGESTQILPDARPHRRPRFPLGR